MAPTALEKAVQEREALKHTVIDYLEVEFSHHSTYPLTAREVDYLLKESAKAAERDAVDIHTKIMVLKPEDSKEHVAEYALLRRKLGKLISSLTGLKMGFEAEGPKSSPTTITSTPDIKLPKLELPSFDGNLFNWVSFRDIFTTAVHNNTSLSKSQKFTYLKAQLQGEALRQVNSMIITDANYDTAWSQLAARYHNERELLFCVMRKLFSQPTINDPSANAVRQLVDTTRECLRSLDVLNCPTDKYGAFITYLLFTKMDSNSRELWELGLKDSSIPDLTQMFEFLETRARALSASSGAPCHRNTKPTSQRSHEKSRQRSVPHTRPQPSCPNCQSKTHYIFKCPAFLAIDAKSRLELVNRLNACSNCLRTDHSLSKCPNAKRCYKCKSQHHTLLHVENNDMQVESSSTTQSMHLPVVDTTESLLATALILVTDKFGVNHQLRAFLDSGAQGNYLTESASRRLQLPKTRKITKITGMGNNEVGKSRGSTTLVFAPHFDSSKKMVINALIVESITGQLPHSNFSNNHWHHLQGLKLADPKFYEPQSVDLLLGAEVFFTILEAGKRMGQVGAPIAVQSSIGWLVGGGSCSSMTSHAGLTKSQDLSLETLVENFWKMEALPNKKHLSHTEKQCMTHFQSTMTKSESGRFVVSLPFESSQVYGETLEMAKKRLMYMEKRLDKLPAYKEQYVQFMAEYEELGHMTEVYLENPKAFYIPHHFVLKPDSTTTKLRVVFDASAKSSNGKSLNDCLMAGPTVQENLFDIILRFRMHKIAYCADITKMYRQVLVCLEDADRQRILWRENPDKPIRHFRLNTVTYGTAPAPFLATQCLQALAETTAESHPNGSKTLKHDFYVDDCMSGSNTIEQAIQTTKELSSLLLAAGFPLRKWISNDKQFLETIPSQDRETSEKQTFKTLGINWNPNMDTFAFTFIKPGTKSPVTKRKVLAEVSKYFDPIGWLSPVIICKKLLIQELWKAGISWDEEIPERLINKWDELQDSWRKLTNVQILRPYFHVYNNVQTHLVGYCDASEVAFAACVYVCCYDVNNCFVSSSLVASKTRLAPLKTVSLPRLELCSALLLAELMEVVTRSLKSEFTGVSAWTDSMDSLCWIQGSPSKWKTFVANRVAKIQELVPANLWGHISGNVNPADCASRGISADELSSHPLWWHGPPQLTEGPPKPGNFRTQRIQSEVRRVNLTQPTIENHFLTRFSSYTRLLHVTAFIFKFYFKLRQRLSKCNIGISPFTDSKTLSSDELKYAILQLVKLEQRNYFHEDLRALQQEGQLHRRSKLLCLAPFIDVDGVIRVGGRLDKSHLPYESKHPILLPKNSHLTMLLILYEHKRTMHGGAQVVQATIAPRFWILNARDRIRHLIRKCTVCIRHRGETIRQFMGSLPSFRVNPSRPFSRSGVDFAGPFCIRPMLKRSKVQLKLYLCLFVCVATRAIHIEVVSSLSTESFLACFRRFVARRGLPKDVYSDCGRNFVGAARELKELYTKISTNGFNNTVAQNLAQEGVSWHFNPPSSPHFGGLWEAGVKSMKFHLRRIIGNQILTFEELLTITNRIEAILNSRPISAVSSDPKDMEALTPGHFLVGSALISPPEDKVDEIPLTRLNRWQLTQNIVQHFWRRWSAEYLTRLQHRTKWLTTTRNLQKNDLVIIKEENRPPQQWRLGRVLETYPGEDNKVRTVLLKTTSGIIKRPTVKLCALPTAQEE